MDLSACWQQRCIVKLPWQQTKQSGSPPGQALLADLLHLPRLCVKAPLQCAQRFAAQLTPATRAHAGVRGGVGNVPTERAVQYRAEQPSGPRRCRPGLAGRRAGSGISWQGASRLSKRAAQRQAGGHAHVSGKNGDAIQGHHKDALAPRRQLQDGAGGQGSGERQGVGLVAHTRSHICIHRQTHTSRVPAPLPLPSLAPPPVCSAFPAPGSPPRTPYTPC